MRALVLLLVAIAAGCGDDSAGAPDLAAPAADAGAGNDQSVDTNCAPVRFAGLPFPPPTDAFVCTCGCILDSFDAPGGPLWGYSHTSGAAFDSMSGVGLGIKLTSTGGLEIGSLASEGPPTSQFYLYGDFDLRVDYDLGATPPPGAANLVLGVRAPGTLSGTRQYEVRRQQTADGANGYAAHLGGVPDVVVPTAATHGTLRLTRKGYTITAWADGKMVTALVAQDTGNLTITLAATLQGCTVADAGASCGYEPIWRNLVLDVGTLINQP